MKRLVLLIFLALNIQINATEEFNQVLSKYEELHQAFYKNDIKAVNQVSVELSKKISEIKDQVVLKKLKYTQQKLEIMGKEKGLEAAQASMNIVSQGILVVLEKDLPNKDYARYYCPMVKKYWIQNVAKEPKVHNPYASDSMPHCGERK